MGALVVACGSFGGSDSGGGGGPPGGTPDQNAQPPLPGDPIVGIFVSAHGSPGGDGSIAQPVNTIRAGIALGKSTNQRVVVCAEEYAESIELADGVSIYGYFDCSNPQQWVQVPDRKAKVKSPTSPALVANGLTLPTRVEGFEIIAPDLDAAPAPSPDKASSIGAFVTNSTSLAFGSVILRGGKGAPGADAPATTEMNEETQPLAAVGGDSIPEQKIACTAFVCTRIPGAHFGTSVCKQGQSGHPGGQGGDGMWAVSDCNPQPSANTHGLPSSASADSAAGGSETAQGTDGDFGAHGKNGTTPPIGTFAATGYVPTDGLVGEIGAPGLGGGGGGGSPCYSANNACVATCSPPYRTATGGGGGAGGCGGLPGNGGKGGGASIGLFSLASTIVIENSDLSSSNGGAGGKGGAGSDGLAGGKGGNDTKYRPPPLGNGVDNGDGGGGGSGGPGGAGGYGGHGTPGPSIALVYSGARPTSATQTLTLTPGTGGAGAPQVSRPYTIAGRQGTPVTIGPGTPGESLPELAF